MYKSFLFILSYLFFISYAFAFTPLTPKVSCGGEGVFGGDADGAHCVVLKPDGRLWSWGRNNNGQVGDGTYIDRNTPVQIGEDEWIDVSAGYDHTVAIKKDGSLWGWGDNSFGQLGLGNEYYRVNTPTRIGNENNWVQVSAGYYFTIAKKSDGTLWAFGNNASGQLGDGSFFSQRLPVQVQVPSGVNLVKFSAGGNHVLAISSNGELYAWGENEWGQVGNNDPPNDVGTPVKIEQIQTGF